MDIVVEVKKLGLPAEKFVVVGGSSLAIRGLRETDDIDLVVLPEIFEKLVTRGWSFDTEYEERWGRKRLKHGIFEAHTDLYLEKEHRFIDIQSVIDEADVINGVRFQTLRSLRIFKLDSARNKDLKDIVIIDAFLNTNSYKLKQPQG